MPAEEAGVEHIPKPKNEQVDAFREEIDRWFVKYQTFYDRSNAAMREYRLAHVDLVTRIYQEMMTVFGTDIEAVRQAAYELNDLIEDRRNQIGEVNDCLREIIDARTENSARVGSTIQQCAIFANRTLSGMLTNTFYPTFAEIQTSISTVPISVIDVLSRGNVLEDEDAILEYLRARYEVIELQWLGAVSQLLRWETNRFDVDGEFLVDEMLECMASAVIEYLLVNSRLEGEVHNC